MKKILLITTLLFASCSPEIDAEKAKAHTTELLELLKDHQYDKIEDYYADSFNASESTEVRIKKFQQIETAAGSIQSYELISSEKKALDERNMLVLKYKVTCTKIPLTHSFIVAIEEGDYKVLNHDVSNL